MGIVITGTSWGDVTDIRQPEWIITNGLGGFATGTVVGIHTRRYHGLLVVVIRPEEERTLLLSKVEEEIVIGEEVYRLSVNEYEGAIHPQGYQYLHSFRLDPWPVFVYNVAGHLLEKQLFMPRGANRIVITYRLMAGEGPVILRLLPLVNCRNYHHLTHRPDWPFDQEPDRKGTVVTAFAGAPPLALYSTSGQYHPTGFWYHGMVYAYEKFRGLEWKEDHYNPGRFECRLQNEGIVSLVAEVPEDLWEFGHTGNLCRQPPGGKTAEAVWDSSEVAKGAKAVCHKPRAGKGAKAVWNRLRVAKMADILTWQQQKQQRLDRLAHSLDEVLSDAVNDEFLVALLQATDAFIIRRPADGKYSIIAGYPWFMDWGRDTMIALPGLCLVPRRFSVAMEIMENFARYCQRGLLPNRFPAGCEKPEYNSADASLWFFVAVKRYLDYTGDYKLVLERFYPILQDIVHWYQKGTWYGITMDEDGLIMSGTPGVQLTWMDAKVGEWVVTPREGKAVEINALWYNVLQFMALLSKLQGDGRTREYQEQAAVVRRNFVQRYWNEEKRCLRDVVDGKGPGDEIRPNQIFAVSLPYPLLDEKMARAVVETVWTHLFTPMGLRSLSPTEAAYRGRYGGNQRERDAAYHQGTVWAWLLGPFVTAVARTYSRSGKNRHLLGTLLAPMRAHLQAAGLGTISEIFEGDYPHEPRGCIAQAWSVAEVLRAYVEDVIGLSPRFSEKEVIKDGPGLIGNPSEGREILIRG